MPESFNIKIKHILRSELSEEVFENNKKPKWTQLKKKTTRLLTSSKQFVDEEESHN